MSTDDLARSSVRWRAGRKVGRTIYEQFGLTPSDSDPLIGVMDTPELAGRVVDAVNSAALQDIPAEDVADYLANGLIRLGWSKSSAHTYAAAAVGVLRGRYRIEVGNGRAAR